MLRAGRKAPTRSFQSCTSRPIPLKKTTVSMLLKMARYVADVQMSCAQPCRSTSHHAPGKVFGFGNHDHDSCAQASTLVCISQWFC